MKVDESEVRLTTKLTFSCKYVCKGALCFCIKSENEFSK